jgi:cell division protein FtsI/penicillin-binding protein 2
VPNIKSKHKSNITKNSKSSKASGVINILKNVLMFCLGILFFWLVPLSRIFRSQIGFLGKWLQVRENSIRLIGVALFLVLGLHFASLQVWNSVSNNILYNNFANANDVVLSKKGNIYVKDYLQKTNIALTGLQTGADLFIDVVGLNKNIKTQEQLKEVSDVIASSLNINISTLQSQILSSSQSQKNSKYVIVAKNLNSEQRDLFESMRSDPAMNKKWKFTDWINITEVEKRNYPQGPVMAQTLGFSPFYKMSKEEVLKRRGCEDLIVKNSERGTLLNSYSVGERGLEQKYCSVIGGINGKKNAVEVDAKNSIEDKSKVVDGADIYTTIDINIQKKAEKTLEEAIKDNQGPAGSPKDGCIMVMEADTGNVIAMASYPYFDPNYYNDFAQISQQSFVNNCTTNDYEVGSVMKPLTVATGLDLYYSGAEYNGKKLGVGPGFSMVDYDSKGKKFLDGKDENGDDNYINITNARGRSFQDLGTIGLKEIVRDSINTGIAEIVPKITTPQMQKYIKEKFLFETETNLNFSGDSNGDLGNLEDSLNCIFCYANYGFGQGFKISPLQLMRSYTALANGGTLIEPKIVSKIECKDGSVETEKSNGSCVSEKQKLNRREARATFNPEASKLVTEYMLATSEEGFLGAGAVTAVIPGHRIAVKSGTAQISRPIINSDNSKTPCGPECNTKLGLYDHTFIGYNVSGKRYIVMIKIAEPRPGVQENFASVTLAKHFNNMTTYTLDYFNVPKDK